MIGAVDLDQFAHTVSAIPGLVDLWTALPARGPDTFLGHPTADRLFTKEYVVEFPELLGG
jgi:hypothetical protein